MPSVFTLSGPSMSPPTKAKAAPGTATRQRFADFLLNTLGPDLRQSGREATSADVVQCGELIRAGRTNAKFARWLKHTLIPDLRASGMQPTARTLSRCVRYISPRQKP